MKRKNVLAILSLVLAFVMTVSMTGCAATVQAADLTEKITPREVSRKELDSAFLQGQMELAVKLFQASAEESGDENVLISPLSISLALAMTAGGAKGQTLTQMEALLGGPISQLNESMYSYMHSLPSGEGYKLSLANSIWFRDDKDLLQVEPDFLQRDADYYGAQIYKAPFDDQTVKDINNWVNIHTDGMIPEILDRIDPNTVMFLINALAFDARWQNVYSKEQVGPGSFTGIDGQERTVDMMHSEEWTYLEDSQTTGFIKDYQSGKYRFAALLPKEGVSIQDYIAGLTADSLRGILESAQHGTVIVSLPKFQFDYSLSMNQALQKLGMPLAFDSIKADFTGMGHSNMGNIYIGNVLHKTFISVDELGTKAGAVTSVMVEAKGAPMEQSWVVELDRPFVFLILDGETNLPVFIGSVMDIQK